MTQEERVIHMVEKIKERINKCEPISAVLLVQTSEFIQDSYNDKEIDVGMYNELRRILRTTANSFPNNCSCIGKK